MDVKSCGNLFYLQLIYVEHYHYFPVCLGQKSNFPKNPMYLFLLGGFLNKLFNFIFFIC